MLNMPFHMDGNHFPGVQSSGPSPGGVRTCSCGPARCLSGLLGSLRPWLRGLMSLLLMTVTCQVLAATSPELRAEVQLSDTRPYAQQTVILRLHVTHSPEVTELDVAPLQASDFTLRLISGPPRTTRYSGPQQVSTDFVYALTPLSSGPLRLPPLVVQAKVESATEPNAQPAFREISSSESLSLEVQALPEEAAALLPLYALDITLRHDTRTPLRVGEPFEVSIVQHAAGVTGERLRDAALLLKSADFSIYPGRSSTSSRLVRNGQLLEGQRIDTLTLIPLRGGQLQMPAISLPWWDIGRARSARTSWPVELLKVLPESLVASTPAAGAPFPGTSGAAPSPVPLWSTIIGLALAFAGGWWLRGSGIRDAVRPGKLFGNLRQQMRPGWSAGGIWRHAAASRNRFSNWLYREGRSLDRIRARLPNPWAIAHETGQLRKELAAARDAEVLKKCLLEWGNKVLGLPLHTTLTRWGQTMAHAYPQVDSESLGQLLAALDAALYGGMRGLEIEAWKRAFRTEFDQIGRHRPFHNTPIREWGLPALNPV